VVGEAKPADLDTLCLDAVARFKRPKDYVFVDALPKNNYGKILKTELRVMDAKRAGSLSPQAAASGERERPGIRL
jgi:long-chain acyl-CoA synthetase